MYAHSTLARNPQVLTKFVLPSVLQDHGRKGPETKSATESAGHVDTRQEQSSKHSCDYSSTKQISHAQGVGNVPSKSTQTTGESMREAALILKAKS